MNGASKNIQICSLGLMFLFISLPGLTGFSKSIAEPIILVYFVSCVFRNKISFDKKELIYFLLFFILILLSSLLNTENILYPDLLGSLVLLVIVFAIYKVLNIHRHELRFILVCMCMSIYVHLFFSIMQTFSYYGDIFHYLSEESRSIALPSLGLYRAYGLLFNPNELAYFCLTIIPITFYIKRFDIFVAAFLCGVLTFSKTFLLLAPVLTIFCLYYCGSYRMMMTILVIILISFSLFLSYYSYFLDAYLYRFQNADSLESRLDLMNQSYNLFKNDFIFGLGAGGDVMNTGRVHNRFFSIFIQFGLFSFLAYLGYLLMILLKGFKLIRAKNEQIYIFLSFVSFLIVSMVSTLTFFIAGYISLPLIMLARSGKNKFLYEN